MSIHYELSFDDYWQFVKYLQWKKAGRPLLVILFLIVMHLGWIEELLSLPAFFRSPSIASSWRLLMFPALSWFLYSEVWGLKYLAKRAARKNPGLLGPHQLRIGPLSIRDNALGAQSCALWESITDIVETRSQIFLCLKGQNAFIVPKSAFNTIAKASEFLGLARTYRDNYRQNSVSLDADEAVWPPPSQSGIRDPAKTE